MKVLFIAITLLTSCALGLSACAECTEECENQCAAADCSCESVEKGECICEECGTAAVAVP